MNIFQAGSVLCWLVVMAYWALKARDTKKTVEREKISRRIVTTLLFTGFLVALFNVREYIGLERQLIPQNMFTGIPGLILTFLGMLIAIRARQDLKDNWSGMVTLKEQHELVTYGTYGFVRHPIYSGVLLMCLGSTLVFGTVGAYFLFLIVLVGLLQKIKREEKLLLRHFGTKYEDYCRRVRALVPFVY